MILELFRHENCESPLIEMLDYLAILSGWKTYRASWTGEFLINFTYQNEKLTAFISFTSRVSNGDTSRESALANIMTEALIRKKLRAKTPKLPPMDYYSLKICKGHFDNPPSKILDKCVQEEYVSELHGFYQRFANIYKWAAINSIS